MAAGMLATATVVAYGLGTGFARSARATDLPDVIARFNEEPLSRVLPRIRALPNLAAASFRLELTNTRMGTGRHFARNGVIDVLNPGRRGFAIVAGHGLSGRPGEVLVEQGVAHTWGLHPGSTLFIGGLGPQRVVGVTVASDNVAYPLAAPRVYESRGGLEQLFGHEADPHVNMVELWARNRATVDQLLVQAREGAYGIRGLRFVTRAGVRILVDQAAGIVIALLVALSVIALLSAGVMLAASARADVQHRLRTIGVLRAIGATRGHIAALGAAEAMILAAPAAALGVLGGTLVASGPSNDLLDLLNERPPGLALILPLLGCWLLATALPVAAVAWPSWRATARAPVALLRGAELRPGRPARHAIAGVLGLGARLASARRTRLAATLAVLGTSAAFILLLLALASELSVLENDPSALGKRYQLLSSLPARAAGEVRALPGVAAAAPRYELTAADSFSLGETIDVIAYSGNHVPFEAPPLASGHRLQGDGEVEVGTGLAQVLGLSMGSTLPLALPSGAELRFKVAGIVSSLDHEGRVAYVTAPSLLRADPAAPEQIAVRLKPGAEVSAVSRELTALGASASATATITGKGEALVSALKAILRAVAGVDGLVCLYTLLQALALTAAERRGTIAVLRACGAGRGGVVMLLAGAGAVVVLPAALIGVALERALLGPAMARIAANYVVLPLGAGLGVIVVVLLGLLALGALAVAWVARQASREPVANGLPA
jgi:ABC-type lipoprotein release transport system permease subunit